MIAATLFSGIGAPEAAMPSWRWAWCAEIEKFPCTILAQRHPHSTNLGDVNGHDFAARAAAIARPDVIVFGSPCQSFSVAGKRLGLDDARGNLALIALGIVDRLKPRWFVFENVPGLLSSAAGHDFGLFLRAVDELGYSLAWTVLDAQYFGVAQRRERVFAVGYLGDWRGPAAVLFEPESLCGHHPPRRQAGQGAAPTIASRATAGFGLGTDFDCDRRLITRDMSHCLNAGGMGRIDYESETLITHALRADGFDANEDGTGRGTPMVAIPIHSDATRANSSALTPSTDAEGRVRLRDPGVGIGEPDDPMFTLLATLPHAIAFSCKDHGADAQDDLSPTLRAGTHHKSHANSGVPPAVAWGIIGGAQKSKNHAYRQQVSGCLQHKGLAATGNEAGTLIQQSAVRRLTPQECERLQGYPDDYTLVSYRGKPAADGPRYKALGNSMAVPVVRWILSRIETADALLSYDGASGNEDFARSFHACLAAVRARKAAGGKGWEPA